MRVHVETNDPFFTFFLMNIDPAHHIHNIQLTENVIQWNLFISKFSRVAPDAAWGYKYILMMHVHVHTWIGN